MARERIGEILIKSGHLDEASLQRALNEQQRWGGQLGRYLVDMGMISEETLVRALSTQFKLPAVALEPQRLNLAVARLIPKEICERHRLISFRADMQKRFLDVAMTDPTNADGLEEVRVATHFNVRPHIAAPSIVDRAINFVFYGDVVGGEVDLSPDSPLRNDSELLRKAKEQSLRSAPPPAPTPATPPASTAPPPVAAAPQHRLSPPGAVDLKLKISERRPPPPPASPAPSPPLNVNTPSSLATLNSIRPVSTSEDVHITLDVPAVEKEINKTQTALEERLAFMEAVQARDAAILQSLLEVLVKRGVLTREEVLRLIVSK